MEGREDYPFETAIQSLRDAFTTTVASKNSEIAKLRNEISKRDDQIADLRKGQTELKAELQHFHSENEALNAELGKFRAFHQKISSSFEEISSFPTPRGNNYPRKTESSFAPPTFTSKVDPYPTSSPYSRPIEEDPYQRKPQLPADSEGEDFYSHPSGKLPASPPPQYPPVTTQPFVPQPQPAFQPSYQPGPQQPTPSAPPAASGPAAGGAKAAAVNGKDFFAKAKEELDKNEFARLLEIVQAYNQKQKKKDEMIAEVQTLLQGTKPELMENFHKMFPQK